MRSLITLLIQQYNFQKPGLKTGLDFRGQGPVVRKPINANPGLNVNPGFHLAH